MPKTETLVDFKGPISYEIMETLLNELRATKDFQGMNKPARKRLYGTFVESIDNIFKYASGDAAANKSARRAPKISVKKRGDAFVVTSGNLVSNDDIGDLRFKLDRVNQLDNEGLKSLYEEIINRESREEDRGAGLGLITMALKTEHNINYSFKALDMDYSFFEMQITINE
jgi:hypothetical protein